MTIGERIKELRKKNNLTQEKMAAYLTVSFQAVSKWETGMACPDLSMIEPLTKLFHVSADELLGIGNPQSDTRREEIERQYDQTYETGDFAERQRICEQAVKEYPGDMRYLCNLAWVISNRSFEYSDQEKYVAEQEKAIKLFASVIHNCRDEYMRGEAISGITQLLSWRGRSDEAKTYAMMLPERTGFNRDAVWENCLTGDELIRFKQERIYSHLEGIIWDVSLMSDPCCSANTIKELLNVMLPDGNYIEFNLSLFYAKRRLVNHIMQTKEHPDPEQVTAILQEMAFIAKAYDTVAFEKPGIYRYTAPLFDHIETDTREWLGSKGSTISDDFKEFLSDPVFDPIRDHIGFQQIWSKLTAS